MTPKLREILDGHVDALLAAQSKRSELTKDLAKQDQAINQALAGIAAALDIDAHMEAK